jgi:hypothetical protein
MNRENDGSGRNSGRMSDSASADESKIGEAEFIEREAENARQALSMAMKDLGQCLVDGADPRLWTREHPWIMAASAAVAGFSAAALLVPSKEQQALRKLAEINRAIAPRMAAVEVAESEEEEPPRRKGRSIGGVLIHEFFDLLKPAVMSALSAGLAARSAAEEGADGEQRRHEQYSPPMGPPDERY